MRNERWVVVSEQDKNPDGRYQTLEVGSEAEAEEVIACLQVVDPEGVYLGLYGIDGPCED